SPTPATNVARLAGGRRSSRGPQSIPSRHVPRKIVSDLNHGANGFAFVHQGERLVDVLAADGVGDKGVEAKIAAHGLLDHAGQLATAFHTTKRRAAPDAAGNQLERARADLLAGAGDADNDAF